MVLKIINSVSKIAQALTCLVLLFTAKPALAENALPWIENSILAHIGPKDDARFLRPQRLTVFNDKLYYVAGIVPNRKLYESDGTIQGTREIPLPAGFKILVNVDKILTTQSALYITIESPATGRELGIFKPGDSQVRFLGDLNPGSASTHFSEAMGSIGNCFFFTARTTSDSQLFRTDGTLAGTKAILSPEYALYSKQSGNQLVFVEADSDNYMDKIYSVNPQNCELQLIADYKLLDSDALYKGLASAGDTICLAVSSLALENYGNTQLFSVNTNSLSMQKTVEMTNSLGYSVPFRSSGNKILMRMENDSGDDQIFVTDCTNQGTAHIYTTIPGTYIDTDYLYTVPNSEEFYFKVIGSGTYLMYGNHSQVTLVAKSGDQSGYRLEYVPAFSLDSYTFFTYNNTYAWLGNHVMTNGKIITDTDGTTFYPWEAVVFRGNYIFSANPLDDDSSNEVYLMIAAQQDGSNPPAGPTPPLPNYEAPLFAKPVVTLTLKTKKLGSLDIATLGELTGGMAVSFEAVKLPKGIKLNTQTGVLSGKLSSRKASFAIVASNEYGLSQVKIILKARK